MSEKKIVIHQEFNVSPETIYENWLTSNGHERLTGGSAEIRNELNSEFKAWDGYISGIITELVPNRKIVQTWRTSEFADSDKDSLLEVRLKPSEKGTLFTLIHTQLADDAAIEKYTTGWKMHYIKPMLELFNS